MWSSSIPMPRINARFSSLPLALPRRWNRPASGFEDAAVVIVVVRTRIVGRIAVVFFLRPELLQPVFLCLSHSEHQFQSAADRSIYIIGLAARD